MAFSRSGLAIKIQSMSELKCPFSILQAAGYSRCHLGREVIRRGGSEYDCEAPEPHARCGELVEHLNAVALPALGYADDLTQTPRSVYQRILLGGLRGLQGSDGEIDDIDTVIAAAVQRFGGLKAIPAQELLPAISRCEVRKRRKKER